MTEPLDEAAVRQALSEMDGWVGGTDGITRTVSLPSFPTAIAVVDRIAVAAEEMDHHPDIDIRWRTLTLRLVTHASDDRVTGLDIALARLIDVIVTEAS